jgi:hypothetical protein
MANLLSPVESFTKTCECMLQGVNFKTQDLKGKLAAYGNVRIIHSNFDHIIDPEYADLYPKYIKEVIITEKTVDENIITINGDLIKNTKIVTDKKVILKQIQPNGSLKEIKDRRGPKSTKSISNRNKSGDGTCLNSCFEILVLLSDFYKENMLGKTEKFYRKAKLFNSGKIQINGIKEGTEFEDADDIIKSIIDYIKHFSQHLCNLQDLQDIKILPSDGVNIKLLLENVKFDILLKSGEKLCDNNKYYILHDRNLYRCLKEAIKNKIHEQFGVIVSENISNTGNKSKLKLEIQNLDGEKRTVKIYVPTGKINVLGNANIIDNIYAYLNHIINTYYDRVIIKIPEPDPDENCDYIIIKKK